VDWAIRRRLMVERQLRGRGIWDERVLAAMLEIPREEFVPEPHRASSYADEPASIGRGQTISQPYMVALMVQCLELTGSETVLEVGAGCGYHAAVLGAVAARVITVERIPELARMARQNLERTGRSHNILVINADGSQGYAESAPYDAISVAAAAPEIPPALLEQLKAEGRMVMPVGSGWDQELRVLHKSGGEVRSRVAAYCRFVPLREGAPQDLD
jgi:protein-L-isoaspartate(D-aspartate) O-methyltransferase